MIAVFSDAHGISYALRAVLEDIRRHGADRLIFLGDALTGPDPRGTMDVIRACDCISIAGNVEQWIIQGDIYRRSYPETDLVSEVCDKMLWDADNIGQAHLMSITIWKKQLLS